MYVIIWEQNKIYVQIPFDLSFRPTIGDGSLVRLLYWLARPDDVEGSGSLSIFLPTLAGISSTSLLPLPRALPLGGSSSDTEDIDVSFLLFIIPKKKKKEEIICNVMKV
jgi:hypothetical protein